MSHHLDHDQDLIMALAEGSLSASETAAAQQQIESCPECVEGLDLQRAALAAFSAAPAVTLTELEAARLKRDLDTALGHERTVVAPMPAKRRGFNWVPVFSVAAALLALVLVAPMLSLVGESGDDAGDEVALAPPEQDLDAGAAEEPTEGLLRTESVTEAAGDDAAADGGAAAEAAPAPTSTTTAAVAADEAVDVSAAQDLIDQLDARLSPFDSVDDARLKAAVYGVTAPEAGDAERCVLDGADFFDVTGADSYAVGDVDLDTGSVRVTAHPERSSLGLAAHLEEACKIIADNNR